MDAKERKKIQNRMAQRTYRRNQKERVRSLELAAGQRMANLKQTLPLTPAPSQDKYIWPSLIDDNFMTSLEFSPLDVSETTQIESFEADKLSSREGQEGDSEPVDSPIPETHSSLKRTSLHRAICARREAAVRLLLEQGADAAKHDSNGHTALHLAVRSGQESLVKALLESKVDPSLLDVLGRTALFETIQSDNESMAKLLLDSSIDVNRRDTFGDVALHVAAEKALSVDPTIEKGKIFIAPQNRRPQRMVADLGSNTNPLVDFLQHLSQRQFETW